MKAASLFGVILAAKLLVLAGRELDLSPWALAAFFWQDLLVALLFAAADSPLRRRPWAAWTAYALLSLYTAINVPVTRILATPLTWPMLRAARGTLADSIVPYLAWENLRWTVLVLAVAAGLPFLLRKLKHRAFIAAGAVALATMLLGIATATRLDTQGFERNAVAALFTTAFPRVASRSLDANWRESPFPSAAETEPETDKLRRLRGAAKGRNVVLMLLESTGARYLRPYGAQEDPMPNLSELARKAILFENASSVYPESIKGLFSVLCATYPALDTKPEAHGKARVPSIAMVLVNAGYKTGLFHSGRFLYLGMDSIVRDRGFHSVEDAGDIGGNHDSSFGIDEPSAVKRILDWIDGLARGERFLVTYLPVAGHHPYETPEKGPFPDREEAGRYLNALHHGDAALKQLLDGLKERGLYESTLFFFLGDHGEAFHQHAENYGHTFFVYEENVHVPYLIVAPGVVEEPLRIRRVSSLIDTAPTILDLLGLEAPREWQGSSLLDDTPRMALFFTDYSLALLGLRDGSWKLIHEVESGRSKLFDLSHDPAERENLAERFPERVDVYRRRLLEWSAAQRAVIERAGKAGAGPPAR